MDTFMINIKLGSTLKEELKWDAINEQNRLEM
jgi:hypothetical protein